MTEDIRILDADWERHRKALMAVRTRVFVEEQKVPPELEMDDYDAISRHARAVTPEGRVIGTARLLPDGHVGRMCVLPQYRGRGVGSRLLQHFIDMARAEGMKTLELNAQVSALAFYQRFGFEPVSDIFIEAGIEHQAMRLEMNHK
jgi:predicted GNAT family N-acyltransferase